jgi:malonate decarboxylase delta subunit
MEALQFEFRDGRPVSDHGAPVLVGVVASGNLEILVEPAALGGGCRIDVHTAAQGFAPIWRAVLADFFERARPGDLQFSINDVGATPAVVSLRLDQALEEYRLRTQR